MKFFEKYNLIIFFYLFVFVLDSNGQSFNDKNIKEYFKNKSIKNFVITSKYLWVNTLDEHLFKTNGIIFKTYYIDEKSEGYIDNYINKKEKYDGYFSKILNYNDIVWMLGRDVNNVLKIENDTIINYNLKLIIPEDKHLSFVNVDESGKLHFLVSCLYNRVRNKEKFKICKIDEDSLKIIDLPPFPFSSVLSFLGYDNKVVILVNNEIVNSKRNYKLYIIDDIGQISKQYELIYNENVWVVKYFINKNKIYFLSNAGDLTILSDNDFEQMNIGLKTDNTCFDFLINEYDILIVSDNNEILSYDLNKRIKNRLCENPIKDYGMLRNIKLLNNKIYGNYGPAHPYDCENIFHNGFEIIDLNLLK